MAKVYVQKVSEKNQPNGYVGLDGNGMLPHSTQSAQLANLFTFGDSYGTGAGVGNPASRATAKLAVMLGLTAAAEAADNHAVNGALLGMSGLAQGGWTTIFNVVAPQRPAAPYLAPIVLSVLRVGINDIAFMGPSNAGFLTMWKAVLTACASRIRVSQMYDDTHAVFFWSGGNGSDWSGGDWGAIDNLPDVSTGSTLHNTSANGAKYRIILPADFPGGVVSIYLVGGNGQRGTHTFTVDGGAAGSVNTSDIDGFNPQGNPYRAMCWRSATLTAGTHTIIGTISGVAGSTFVDSAGVEGSPAPFLLIPDQNLPLDYSAYGGTEPHVPIDADVSALNSANRTVAALFTDGRVLTDGAESLVPRDTAHWAAGNLHPNELAEILLAQAWSAQLKPLLNAATDLDYLGMP